MKIYVASSWRNGHQQEMVKFLRNAGHEVYDFRHPGPDDEGFHWSDIDPGWKDWLPEEFVTALKHPLASDGFAKDMTALENSDVVVLLTPCGRSAHLEAGWAAGVGKTTIAFLCEPFEVELMYKMFSFICVDTSELLACLEATTLTRRPAGLEHPLEGVELSPFAQLVIEAREKFILHFTVASENMSQIAHDHGFYDEPLNVGEKIALAHSELSEALEAFRHGDPPSDKIPDFTSLEEEFADCVIRIMDLAHELDLKLAAAILAKADYNATRPHKHGKEF